MHYLYCSTSLGQITSDNRLHREGPFIYCVVTTRGLQYPVMVKVMNTSKYSSDTIDPDKEGDIAVLKGALWEDWLGVVRAEEKTCFLQGLVMAGVCTNDVENFIFR